MNKKLTINQQLLIFSLGLHLVLYFTPFRFQVNDDVLMMWLVNGAYTGEFEFYAVFIHPILSGFLASLYSLAATIPWYIIIWFLVLSVSCYGWLIIVFTYFKEVPQRLFWSSIYLAYHIHHVYFLQFTAVAGIAGFIGILGLVLRTIEANSKNLSLNVFYFLVISSMLIRMESLLFILFGWAVYLLTIGEGKKILAGLILNKKLIAILVLLLTVQSGFRYSLKYVSFEEFNRARSGVIDHPYYQFTDHELSNNSDPVWYYFKEWLFEKSDSPTVSQLKIKKEELNKGFWSKQYANGFLDRIFETFKYEYYKSFFLIFMTCFCLIIGFIRPRFYLFIFSWIICYIFFNYFFLLAGRVQTMFSLIMIGALFLTHLKFRFKFPAIVFFLISYSFATLLMFHSINVWVSKTKWAKWNKEVYACLNDVPINNLVFIHGLNAELHQVSYDIHNPIPFSMMGWISRSPMQARHYNRLGLKGLDDAKTIYLIQSRVDDPSLLPEYLNYYYGTYTSSRINTYGKFELWKIEKLD
ncbi:hypothetical protein [Mongoliitalea daihaiensis]|uniref:hypothetical protein n=1 Tax=Mongoliitalea daihaiensis TaxID=2782006 RepID=UPI001F480327|nr:hypothetical protein [Mongoliitalea daihaiensis]UJP64156.1 hypothetical protein IPZ59_15245 [Mongoliitalea daihaiensis]